MYEVTRALLREMRRDNEKKAEKAFERVIGIYLGRANALAIGLSVPDIFAEEIITSTFAGLWAQRKKIPVDVNLTAWLGIKILELTARWRAQQQLPLEEYSHYAVRADILDGSAKHCKTLQRKD